METMNVLDYDLAHTHWICTPQEHCLSQMYAAMTCHVVYKQCKLDALDLKLACRDWWQRLAAARSVSQNSRLYAIVSMLYVEEDAKCQVHVAQLV